MRFRPPAGNLARLPVESSIGWGGKLCGCFFFVGLILFNTYVVRRSASGLMFLSSNPFCPLLTRSQRKVADARRLAPPSPFVAIKEPQNGGLWNFVSILLIKNVYFFKLSLKKININQRYFTWRPTWIYACNWFSTHLSEGTKHKFCIQCNFAVSVTVLKIIKPKRAICLDLWMLYLSCLTF